MPPPCTTLQTSQRPSSGCLHGQGGAASREGVSLWRRHSHFAMTYRKGKANFHLRVLVHSRKDHDHGSGHFLKPEGRAEEKWAGMRLPAVHCQQWTRHREKGTTKVTMPMTVQGQYCLRSKHTGSALLGVGGRRAVLRLCCRAGAMAGSELVPPHGGGGCPEEPKLTGCRLPPHLPWVSNTGDLLLQPLESEIP